MFSICDDCHQEYDDAVSWTFCPHERFLTVVEAARKDQALALLGKTLIFNHQGDSSKRYTVEGVSGDGMVRLRNLEGEFHPALFRVVEDLPQQG